MKTRPLLPLVAGLLAAGFALQAVAAPKVTPDNVAVTFQNPDKFTDVLENHSNETSPYYLDQVKECLQQTASPLLAAGQRLNITITDIDLAGDTRLNQPDNIRIIKDIYVPRVNLKFQLLDGDGNVVREGVRKLTDLNFNQKISLPGSNEPLYYDKQLLKEWVRDEFRARS